MSDIDDIEASAPLVPAEFIDDAAGAAAVAPPVIALPIDAGACPGCPAEDVPEDEPGLPADVAVAGASPAAADGALSDEVLLPPQPQAREAEARAKPSDRKTVILGF